jgi:gliding motility-associated-like protein
MKNKLLLIAALFISTFSFSQVPPQDCTESGCDVMADGFPVTPGSGFGTVDESNGPNGSNVSWPNSNPQGVNSGCMFSGELNSTWISFSADVDGPLQFDIGAAGGSGFYDWILWQNVGGDACNGILNNTLAPVACNWNGSSGGFTGMGTTPAGGSASNFQPSLIVNAGDNFILCFSNYSSSSTVVPLSGNITCSDPFIMEPTICEGETVNLEFSDLPPNTTSYSWSPATNISDPNIANPDVWPTDTTLYTLTLVSPDSTWDEFVTVNVVHLVYPDAGLDDSLCQSPFTGYQLQGVKDDPTNESSWEFFQGPPGLPSNAIFQPNSPNNLNANTLVNYGGEYTYVLHETDQYGFCPEGTDTVKIFFSKENHTTTSTNPTCFGYDDGSIQIISDGVLGAIEYSYDNGVTYTITDDSTGFAAGTYTVKSRDILGCEFESTLTLTDPAEITLTAGPSIPDTTVCQNGTAIIYAAAANGTTYSYHWDQTSDLGSTQSVGPLTQPTTLTVFAESELGCLSQPQSINIQIHAPITVNITANDSVCPGYASQMTVEASGGFQAYNYIWTANGVLTSDLTNVININPIIETEYCVTVADVCETTPEDTCSKVIMREIPMPIIVTDKIEGCNPTIINISDNTTYNLAETQTSQLNWLVDGTVYNDSVFDHLFQSVGEYDIQLEVYTNFGCHNIFMTPIDYIDIHEVPSATFYVISNPSTIFNTEVEMVNNTQGDSLTYEWLNIGGLPESSHLESPSILYPEGIAADYPVRLIVENEFNCTDTTYDIVHIISDVIIYAPNAFTPDNDNLNNDWRVYIDGININEFHLIMFNRWGETVWESFDPEGVWDGTYGGNPIQDGTFVWNLITKDATSDKRYEFKGQVTIIR